MKFTISDVTLREMFLLSSFSIPADELVFVALRGSQPLVFGGSGFATSHELITVPIDYRHMRCTIVQWDTGIRELSVFVGSSVPHISAITSALAANGVGVNRLAAGLFGKTPGLSDHRYVKGNHGEDRHLAFRNESKLPVWRTADDTRYDGDDRVEFDVVYDNLHCARQVSETADFYSSYGCVVVAGREGDSGADTITSELGPWKRFLSHAYGREQRQFALAVFEENEALRAAELGMAKRTPTVRFGSRGLLVERLQEGLLAKGYPIGSIAADGLFGGYTVGALRQFQRDVFGKNGTDLICGATTAEALGIQWPASGADLVALSLPPANQGVAAAGLLPGNAAVDTAATLVPAGLIADASIKIALNTDHKPLPGWSIQKRNSEQKWDVFHDQADAPIYLGYFFEYSGYDDGKTRGLARTAGHQPRIDYDPSDWADLGYWPELIFPTAFAESGGNFTVINAWDRAAMTFGFIQLAAHTGDDFLPFFRKLFTVLPAEAKQWFPELDVIDGRLCFVKNGKYRTLENRGPPPDGGFSKSYYHGDLMGFFNPDRYHADGKPDPEELHAGARWLLWTLTSQDMRRLQVQASIDNLMASLHHLHQKMLSSPAVRARYPNGVDGMRCDLLSVAIAAPHLGEGHIPTILSCLTQPDPIEAIRASNYGPADRSENAHIGMTRRPVLRNLIYDMATQEPI